MTHKQEKLKKELFEVEHWLDALDICKEIHPKNNRKCYALLDEWLKWRGIGADIGDGSYVGYGLVMTKTVVLSPRERPSYRRHREKIASRNRSARAR